MNTRGWLLSLSLLAAAALPSLAQQQQQALVPAGSSNLTPGQYMLTNLNSGQALYVVIDQTGRLFAQDPRVLQIVVQQGQITQPGALPGVVPGQTQQGGIGGLLQQGLQNFVNGRMQPQK